MEGEISGNDLARSWLSMLCKRQKVARKAQELMVEKEEAHTCTYDQGQVSQELFHCKTCSIGASAVCTACYLNCHIDHEVIELGWKTGFQCDCGTNRLSGICKLSGAKGAQQDNLYNHNFEGKFCICDVADTEESREDDMTMCVGCQDWFHFQCLRTANNSHSFATVAEHQSAIPGVPKDSDEYFMVCAQCVKQVLFMPSAYRSCIYHESEPLGKRLREESNECVVVRSEPLQAFPYHCFISKDWITKRCLCELCQELYKRPVILRALEEVKPSFLETLDIEASKILDADEEAPEEPEAQDWPSMGHLPHQAQIEVANGVRILADSLNELMQRLSETSQVCGSEHIEEFKRDLQAKYESYKRAKYE
jgi:E3 ubiquitin-protein ligase UBR7